MRKRRLGVPGRARDHATRPAGPAAVLRLHPRRHRAPRARRRRCGGWPTSRPRCAAWPPRWRPSPSPARVFGVVTEEVGRLLGAQTANMVRFDGDGRPPSWAAGTRRACAACRSATTMHAGRRHRRRCACGGPGGRRASTATTTCAGEIAAVAARARLPRRRRRRRSWLGSRLWGAVIVSSVKPEPFPPGAEQRLADFAELAAQALANAQTRARSSPPRARGSSRRATPSAAGWSATCTTARSSGSSSLVAQPAPGRPRLPPDDETGARGVRARRRGARPGARGAARAGARASTRPCSATAAWSRRSRRWPRARRCR